MQQGESTGKSHFVQMTLFLDITANPRVQNDYMIHRTKGKKTFFSVVGLNTFPVLAAPLVKSPYSLIDQPCFPVGNPLKLASTLANSMLTWARRTTPYILGPLNSETAADTKKSVRQQLHISLTDRQPQNIIKENQKHQTTFY